MKICVVSSSVIVCPPPGYSGLEMIAWQTAKGLATLGHEVSLVAPEGSTCPGVTIVPCGPAGQWDERHAFRTYAEHLLTVDCVIDHSWNKFALSLRQSGQLKAPVLCVMHAPIPGMLQSLPPVVKPCFVCISHDQASHFDALFNYKPEVVWNGLDTMFYRDLKIGRSDRFLFLARFSRIKGATIAQDVCKAAGVGLDLIGDTTITGEPDYLAECMARADGQQIRIVGPASRTECVHWFSQSRALLHLNRYFREPYGLSPVEAQLCGNPVLSWDFGAMRETVKHGETGFLVRSEQEAIDIIKDGALDRLSRGRCREWAEQFSVERMCKRYEELATKAVNGGAW
jgi:glycosyltransferase involved in cell wall biosynthesis